MRDGLAEEHRTRIPLKKKPEHAIIPLSVFRLFCVVRKAG